MRIASAAENHLQAPAVTSQQQQQRQDIIFYTIITIITFHSNKR